eukprot:6438735-Amphidinium_carterae.1
MGKAYIFGPIYPPSRETVRWHWFLHAFSGADTFGGVLGCDLNIVVLFCNGFPIVHASKMAASIR